MRIYAFVPLRSGSESIPQKNIKTIAGKPLAQWIVDAANASKYIESVTIGVDDTITADTIKNAKIFWRSKASATNTASSEIVLREFCRTLNPEDIVVFLQATCPLISTEEIDTGIKSILNGECESCFSATKQKIFLYDGKSQPILHDLNHRPRRQDWDGFYVENGGFYINKVANILDNNFRTSENPKCIECHSWTKFEIDESEDWLLIEHLLNITHNV